MGFGKIYQPLRGLIFLCHGSLILRNIEKSGVSVRVCFSFTERPLINNIKERKKERERIYPYLYIYYYYSFVNTSVYAALSGWHFLPNPILILPYFEVVLPETVGNAENAILFVLQMIIGAVFVCKNNC